LLQFLNHNRKEKQDVDHTKPNGKQARQFTRDDCARISASAINRVLEKLSVQHTVAGIAVIPAGEGVYLVDIVMRDNIANETWNVSLTIPPAGKEKGERDG